VPDTDIGYENMRTIAYLILGVFLISGCSPKKSKLEESAGDLRAELKIAYNFFRAMSTTPPLNAAENWCDINHSWEYEKDGPLGYYVNTDNEEAHIRMYVMSELYYKAIVFRATHEEVCNTLREMFGQPYKEDTYNDGEYLEWKTDEGTRVTVEKDGISSSVYFKNEE